MFITDMIAKLNAMLIEHGDLRVLCTHNYSQKAVDYINYEHEVTLEDTLTKEIYTEDVLIIS